MERKGICVAGSLIADRFYEVDNYPKEGFLSTVRNTAMHIGGTGNLILDLAISWQSRCVPWSDRMTAEKICLTCWDDTPTSIRQTFHAKGKAP